MNLDHDFVQISELSEDPKKKVLTKNRTFFSPNSGEEQKKKKRSSPKKEHFFPPNSNGHLHSDAHLSQIIGEDADVPHRVLKLLGGYSQIIGGYIPPPPGFWHPCWQGKVTASLLLAYHVFASKSN